MSDTLISSTADDKSKHVDLSRLMEHLIMEENAPKVSMIDTIEAIPPVIDILNSRPTSPPSLYIDLEGINLSRNGTISILQVYVHDLRHTYLLDVHTLGKALFATPGTNSKKTLKAILESASIPKVFFDIRNDSDALHAHFGINLAGIQDLQVMEFATRLHPGVYVNGLAKCIEHDADMSSAERLDWKTTKEAGVRLFAPERGGSYEVFNQRPLKKEVLEYCVQDVEFLPRLWKCYNQRAIVQEKRIAEKIEKAVQRRIEESQSSEYLPHGRHKAIGPW